MTQYRFSVHTPIRRTITSFIVYLIVLFLMIVLVHSVELPVPTLIMACALVLFLTIGMYMTVMLRFQVEGSEIRVRTQFGKRFTVNCGDIMEIICTQGESTKQGMLFFITVATEQNEFTVEGKKEGFDTFAGYLLDQRASGAIRKSAATEECIQMLQRCQKGIFAKKAK